MRVRLEQFDARHVSGAAQLERACFSAPWTEDALREELDNPNALFLAAVDTETGETAGYLGCHLILDEGHSGISAADAEQTDLKEAPKQFKVYHG